MQIDLVRGWSAIEKLKSVWNDFAAAHFPHLCDSFAWHTIALQSSGRTAEPQVLLFHEGDQLIGLLPLQRCAERFASAPVRRYQFWEQSVNMSSLMILPERLGEALGLLLLQRKKWLPGMHILKLTARGEVKKQLDRFFQDRRSNLAAFALPKFSYRICTNGEEQAFHSVLSGKKEHDYARLKRRLEKGGLAGFRHLLPVEVLEQCEECMQRFLKLYRNSWKHPSTRSLTANTYEQNFFVNMMRHFASQELLTCSFLQLNGEDISAAISIFQHGVLHGIQMAYHHNFSQLSPGNLLLGETLAFHATRGPLVFDFMGQHSYKKGLSTERVDYCDYYIFNTGAYSRLVSRLSGWSKIDFQPLG